jgi:RNA polymerase sigma factor (sigma-70 family)
MLIMKEAPGPQTTPWPTGRRSLLALCLRWTRGNLAEAEDLLGDACLRILEVASRGELPIAASPSAFWVTVINNLGRDRLRRARRWKFENEGRESNALSALPAPTVGADQQVLLKECLVATDRKLRCLNERQRAAVLLRGRGVGYSGIGELLSTSPANARKLVEMARRRLNSTGEAACSYLLES